MDEKFYQKVLMEHYKDSKHKKKIENPDFSSGHDNPACGDTISMAGKVTDGVVTEIGFEGSGCVISMAAASMLADKCVGKTTEELLNLTKDDILEMIGVPLGPNRMQCALLALEALHKALSGYKK